MTHCQIDGPRAQNRPRCGHLRTAMFFGKNMSRSRCTGALVEALRRQGLQVRWHNMATSRRWLGRPRAEARVRRAWRRTRPDLVFVFDRDLPRNLLEEFRCGSTVVLWVEESLEDVDRTQVEYFALADLVCMSNPGRFAWLAERGLDNMVFSMSGFSPSFHRPVGERAAQREVAFIGGPGPRGRRARFLAEVSRHFDTEVFGRGWEPFAAGCPRLQLRGVVGNRGFARVCASSKIVLGLNSIGCDRLYFSNRTWLTLACRGFLVTEYVPGLEEVFDNGEHLVWYRDLDDALEQIQSYLGRDRECRRVAAAGHQFALGNHQYFHRVAKILAWLEERERPARAEGACHA